MIDKNLISSCINGSQSAYKQVYDQSIAYVYSIVKRYIDDAETRRDICQEIFANIFSKINSFNGDPNLWKPWIRKISINSCLTYLRSKKKESILLPMHDHVEIGSDKHLDLEAITRAEIEHMLSQMPKGYKLIFMLSVFDGYNHKEIAEQLGINETTSRTQLSRARAWITKQIIHKQKHKAYGFSR